MCWSDAVYGSTRAFCGAVLSRIGAAVSFYDPLVGDGIRGLLRRETKLIVVEFSGVEHDGGSGCASDRARCT